MLLLREILDPKYGMFKEYEETRAIWFSEHTFEDEVHYFLIGKMLSRIGLSYVKHTSCRYIVRFSHIQLYNNRYTIPIGSV